MAILFSVAKSFASIPKESVSTIPKESNIFIAPSAKFSALEVAYIVGNSITKSAPCAIAILALVHLSIIEVFPLWTKFPEITHTT